MKAIGVFGGTFAPVHNGHLRLAIELRERLDLAQVLLIPAAQPPHRKAPAVAPARRAEWLRLAIADEPGLAVDERELHRAGPSYTYDTLAELRREHGARPLLLLLGEDAAAALPTWHRWRELYGLAHLVRIGRPAPEPGPEGAPQALAFPSERRAADANQLRTQPAGCWLPVSIPPLAISSSRIRRLLAAGRSLRGLVPEPVLRSFTAEDLRALSRDENPETD
ncbi:MAG: nicotinate-nucleotide adenylyltransferase [Nevskia sp.]|nr:nicotinate-nucleotide adenylyltransferase [Nevskia sp.]